PGLRARRLPARGPVGRPRVRTAAVGTDPGAGSARRLAPPARAPWWPGARDSHAPRRAIGRLALRPRMWSAARGRHISDAHDVRLLVPRPPPGGGPAARGAAGGPGAPAGPASGGRARAGGRRGIGLALPVRPHQRWWAGGRPTARAVRAAHRRVAALQGGSGR